MSITPTITDEWSDGKRLHEIGTLAFSGNYVFGGVAVNLGAVIHSTRPPSWIAIPPYRGYYFEYVPGTDITNGKLKVSGSTSGAAGTGVLTSDNTNVSNGDTVTIGSMVYTFKTTLPSATAANYVHIGADADASLTNLRSAINGTGTAGTDYGSLTPVNTDVTCGAVTSHTVTVTAIAQGIGASSVVTTEASSHLSWASATLTGGLNGTPTGTELASGAFSASLAALAVPFYGIFPQLI